LPAPKNRFCGFFRFGPSPYLLSHGDARRAGAEKRPTHGTGQPCGRYEKQFGINTMDLFADIIGMSGTALVVGAFYLLQLNKVQATGLQYNLMNLFGATFLLISLCINFNLASFVIEIFWIAASLIGLYKYRKRNSA
jgi:hypothetical protein